MKDYVYSGPLSGVSLKGHGDIMLIPGAAVRLPSDNAYTGRLIRKGWLAEASAPEPVTEPVTEPEPETPKRRR
jgi:hypothetical protein